MMPQSLLLRFALLSGVSLLAASTSRAHHGQEFLVVQDSSVPSLWSGTVFGGFEWSRDGRTDELSAEPGFLLGLGSHVAVGATVGFSGTEEVWGYESASPFLQVMITPPAWPVRVAVIAGYHFADGSIGAEPVASRTVVTTVPVVASKTTGPPPPPAPPTDPIPDPDPPCGPEFGPDAPPCPEPAASPTPGRSPRHAGHGTPEPAPPPAPSAPTSEKSTPAHRLVKVKAPAAPREPYDGIHRHTEDHAFARLVLEADLTATDKLIVNLIGLWPDDGKSAWGYAAGFRHSFSHALAAGIEAIGDFGDANEHELILGGYVSPTHTLTLKFGAGLGLTDESPDFSLRTGVVWRF
jgi:hypothetical protein